VPFNYADTTAAAPEVAGAARPGARAQRCYSDCVASPTAPDEVAEWVNAMKGHGVAAVVSLLSADEAATYAAPGVDAAMRAAFGEGNYVRFNLKDAGEFFWGGGCCISVGGVGARRALRAPNGSRARCLWPWPLHSPRQMQNLCTLPRPPGAASPAAVLAAIDAHVAAGRKVLVHCWGGGGRTGLVQAAWLARARGLPPAKAAAAVADYARAAGVPRRVDVPALEAFLKQAAAA
jgi:hypothetical protein